MAHINRLNCGIQKVRENKALRSQLVARAWRAQLMQANILHYGSISLIEEPCRSAHLAAVDIAKKSGCLLSYDPNLRLPLWPSAEAARDGIMSIWNQSDITKFLHAHHCWNYLGKLHISEEEITFLMILMMMMILC
uniref:Fructokinase n=1 Tax=Quercus lobata TaxID=97700 RepID=A0A7N2R9J1_QUELO